MFSSGSLELGETERIELLRAVAECAPKEMGAHVMEDSCPELRPNGISDTCTRFATHSCVLHLLSDIDDAKACFAMLDALDKELGGGVSLQSCQGLLFGKYCVALEAWDGGLCKLCPTRAEAVSRAFVAVFGGK